MRIRISLLLLAVILLAGEMQAQRTRTSRRTKESREKDTTSFTDHLAFDIRIGNIGIQNGFQLSTKPSVGYKFGKVVSAGLGGRFFYQFVNVFAGEDFSILDKGGFVYTRAKLGQNFYLQGEYAYTDFDYSRTFGTHYKIWYPLLGGGYQSGGDTWKYGLEIMFPLNGEARDYGPVLEYWINITYKF